MASAISTAASSQTLNTLTAKVKSLINNDLRAICRATGLPSSGVKIALQARIIDYLQKLATSNDATALGRMQYLIYHGGEEPTSSFNPSTSATYNPRPTLPPLSSTMSSSYGRQSDVARKSDCPLRFKTNPFYDIIEPVSAVLHLPMIQSNRSNLNLPVKLADNVCQRMRSDSSLRVYLFSTGDPVLGPQGRHEIAFPTQIDVRINQEELRANFKGLKGKPGSTRPADITSFLRKQPTFNNNISITYALTSRRFQAIAMLVKKRSIEELVKQIESRGIITKEQVLSEMRKKANDADIVATSHVMSLKDPLSMSRIQLACRSTVCKHNQCFDATCFLQLQEQAPTWTCPICSKLTNFEGIVVDQYFQEILQTTSKSVEQVTIEPSGEWHVESQQLSKDKTSSNGYPANGGEEDSDDDLVEIIDPRSASVKKEGPITPFSLNTPSVGSREASVTTPAAIGSFGRPMPGGQKRRSEVIDLTLSDDEAPSRPNKRQETSYNTPNGVPDRRNGYPVTQVSKEVRAPSTNGVSFSLVRPATDISTLRPQNSVHQTGVATNQSVSDLLSPRFTPLATTHSASPTAFSQPNRRPSFSNSSSFPSHRSAFGGTLTPQHSGADRRPSLQSVTDLYGIQNAGSMGYQQEQTDASADMMRQFILSQPRHGPETS